MNQTPPNETELAARAVAPRVHQSDVDNAVRKTEYYVFPGNKDTLCRLTLRNGYTVVGRSACVDTANFQQDIGERIAREDAYRQVWVLLGYALQEELSGAVSQAAFGTMDSIAHVCHEVNRAYCQALGDDSQVSWEQAPVWQRESARKGVDLHLMGDFGPEASHISWMNQKADDGWVYGKVKDADAKTHPCMVPFDQLPRDQQAKDYIFRAIVHALRPTRTDLPGVHPADPFSLIVPTVGRVVWFFPAKYDTRCTRGDEQQPMAATVVMVHNVRSVNLSVLDHAGQRHAYINVQLIQAGDACAANVERCEWMPCQQGQAKKNT